MSSVITSSLVDLFINIIAPSISPIPTNILVSDDVREFLSSQFGLLTDEEQEDIRSQALQASEHLSEASDILLRLQRELESRNQELGTHFSSA